MVEAGAVAEVVIRGVWQALELPAALRIHKDRVMRCIECHGRVRAHKAADNGMVAHMEHYQRNPGCTSGDCFDGIKRMHDRAIR